MESIALYNKAFLDIFMLAEKDLVTLKYHDVPEWDSVGHMMLITAIEEAFDIMFDTEDIIGFSSWEKGKLILAKYDVVL
ncbi:acyl carrier protein [Pantoea sp. UYEF8]|uniref:acyl carrier protein n=1 Tax=Pantoea sp. UYEF8 TaxID=1756394 RepID=UPI00339636BA